MKKFFVSFISMLCICLLCSLWAYGAEFDTIKVGLAYGSSAKGRITVYTDYGISYGYNDGTAHVETGQLILNNLTFSPVSDTQIIINDVQTVETGGSNLSIMPLGGNIWVDGKEYRGGIILANVSSTAMSVVNVLSMEDYLRGVVPNEVSSSWNEEALKAQAVCARGFAVSNYSKHASSGFNVCTGTHCQVYGGVSTEKESTCKAVSDTAGQVVMYDGKPIESLFFSSSGGHTANVKNVWGSSVSYLSGVADPYEPQGSPRHSWSVTLTLDQIGKALSASGINVGNVLELSALTDETGRAYELTVKGTSGSHTLKRTGTYSPFASYGVLSQKFSLIPSYSGGVSLYAQTSGGRNTLAGYNIVDSTGKVREIPSGFYMKSSSGVSPYAGGELTGYTFSGGGWGHGVGMSQYGAMGMADSGFTYTEILSHYYPGTTLGNIY